MPEVSHLIQAKSASDNSDSARIRRSVFTMPQFIYNASNLIRRVFFLARPYGRKKLAFIFFLSLAQGIFQVIGLTSIFPFLALAADPERIRHSRFGLRFLALLPPMGNRELLMTAGVIAIAALFFSSGVNLLAEYARTRYAHSFAHWLRVRLLRRMASQPYSYFLRRNSATAAQMSARLPLVANSVRYLVEPLAFGGLVFAVLILAFQDRDFSDILPNLGVMAIAGYRLLPNLQLLYGQITQVASMRYSLDEVFEEFAVAEEDEKSSNVELSAKISHPIEWHDAIMLDEVSFIYPGAERLVLDHFSVTIQKNTSTGFIGPTGSGKSTLIDLVLGLHVPTSGRVLIDGQPLTPEMIPSWHATIGYVPQEIFLIDDTIARNIVLGAPDNEVDRARLQEVCAMAQILELIRTEPPDGFQTTVGERGVRLSGGERQRVGLARALYHRPSLLVLDEATSALDTATEARLIEALRHLSGKLTIITVAHRFSSVANCDRLISLDRKAI